jgi:cytidine deaminase
MYKCLYEKLTGAQRLLLDKAEEAMQTAYSPYSGFCVGAALFSRDHQIITGSCVENASYGSGICAERAAILRANAMGTREFDQIAIIAKGKEFNTKQVTAPCGNCRQVLYEFSQISSKNIEIIMSNTKKTNIIISNIEELFPLGFGPRDLGVKLKKH